CDRRWWAGGGKLPAVWTVRSSGAYAGSFRTVSRLAPGRACSSLQLAESSETGPPAQRFRPEAVSRPRRPDRPHLVNPVRGEERHAMFYRISDIEGIGLSHALKLEKARITTTQHLLEKARDPQARARLVDTTGIRDVL